MVVASPTSSIVPIVRGVLGRLIGNACLLIVKQLSKHDPYDAALVLGTKQASLEQSTRDEIAVAETAMLFMTIPPIMGIKACPAPSTSTLVTTKLTTKARINLTQRVPKFRARVNTSYS